MGVVGLERDRGAGWDFGRAAGGGHAGGAAMIGFRDRGGDELDLRVTGIPAVTVLFEFGGNELVVESNVGRQAFAGFVVGCSPGTMRIRGPRTECVEVRLSPVRAYSLLNIDPTELGRTVVGVEDLFGRRAQWLREQLAHAATWEQRFALTRSFLMRYADPARIPDPEVVAGWDRIVACRGQVMVGALAESCGWSRKRLWARFESQIGLTPKRAAMLVRFRHAVEGLVAGRPAAEVAAICGYTDQSHLSRDVSSFAQVTPGALAAWPLTAISAHRYRAWGTFFQYRGRPTGR
ncbi:helix-turn-helix domain-containing protein [Nocardia sp. NPDC057455]|uniref:helix-turn-helix domain-containing protein n=1 Tax=Nocardia sp. NPDC057455 TaxID=3346138 RepID=UPI00366B8664